MSDKTSAKRATQHPRLAARINQNTTLCLACSCSLPPLRKEGIISPPTSPAPLGEIFALQQDVVDAESSTYVEHLKRLGAYITPCCLRPICPSCIVANPRLQRYDPCLACLGGIDAVGFRSPNGINSFRGPESARSVKNIDGGMKDEDTFILGDDDDLDDLESSLAPPGYTAEPNSVGAVPHSSAGTSGLPSGNTDTFREALPSNSDEGQISVLNTSEKGPWKYYLNKRDTLQGIALRFGLDGRELSRLNKLPVSALNTTPQILHTRSFIFLPIDIVDGRIGNQDITKENEAQRAKEKAEKKLQTLTKEVDYHVVKAYVALADGEEEQAEHRRKIKELQGATRAESSLEAIAIERYLDDDQWEADERKHGRGPRPDPTSPNSRRKHI
ncbi:hypothetical protein FA15DRAFT_586869 [Coprinopsis marcescibilis]|uniref:LysM domain-containing protein n=1 Tax=Coprinopsis marcescibilis TaxID=230819 RepID=A0A5C3L359_COPMA|nr:hypothetical protein FA15DRAFT_586869 [Coprinopsis marcescibilis]